MRDEIHFVIRQAPPAPPPPTWRPISFYLVALVAAFFICLPLLLLLGAVGTGERRRLPFGQWRRHLNHRPSGEKGERA